MGPRRPCSFWVALALMLVPLTSVVAGAGYFCSRPKSTRHSPNMVHICTMMGVMDYGVDVGRWPDTLNDLVVNPGVAGWDGPYTDNGKLPNDVWGNPLKLLRHQDRIYIISAGRPGGKYPVIFPEPQ